MEYIIYSQLIVCMIVVLCLNRQLSQKGRFHVEEYVWTHGKLIIGSLSAARCSLDGNLVLAFILIYMYLVNVFGRFQLRVCRYN